MQHSLRLVTSLNIIMEFLITQHSLCLVTSLKIIMEFLITQHSLCLVTSLNIIIDCDNAANYNTSHSTQNKFFYRSVNSLTILLNK
jgi:hypothetical protein